MCKMSQKSWTGDSAAAGAGPILQQPTLAAAYGIFHAQAATVATDPLASSGTVVAMPWLCVPALSTHKKW